MTSNPPSLSIMNLHSGLLSNLSSFNLSSATCTFRRNERETHIDEVHIVSGGMYHCPECKLVCYLFMKLLSAFRSLCGRLTHIFSSAGNNHCNLGLNRVTRFLSTAIRLIYSVEEDVLGTRIIPPSKASTRPAPLDVQTEYLSPFRTASFAFEYWDHHPYATDCQPRLAIRLNIGRA
jgi:hypothetical protein